MKRFRLTADMSKRRDHDCVCSSIYVATLILFFFTIQSIHAGSLIATWDANSESDLAGYLVLYGTEAGTYDVEQDVGNKTTYVARDLQAGQEYFFVVKAYDLSGNVSAPSLEVSAVASDDPGGPNLIALRENDQVRLIWSSIEGAESFEIYRDIDPYFEPGSPIATVSADELEYVDSFHFQNPEKGTYYTVRATSGGNVVHAFNAVGAYDVTLHQGLNLVSLPLVPVDASLDGVLGDQLSGGDNSTNATKVRNWNGLEYETSWLYDGPITEFQGRWIDSETGKLSARVLDESVSFWVVIQENESEHHFTFTGNVPDEENRSITLAKGFNFVGSIYPVQVSLSESELYEDGVMKGGVGSGEADIIKYWNGSNYELAWVVDGTATELDGVWMDGTGKSEAGISFNPGHGYILWIKGDNPNKTWTFPNPSLTQ